MNTEQIEAIQMFVDRIADEVGIHGGGKGLIDRAQLLRVQAVNGVCVKEELLALSKEFKKFKRLMQTGLHIKEDALKAKYPVGQRVKFYSEEWLTGTVLRFMAPGHSRSGRVVRIEIERDDGAKVDLALIYAEERDQLQTIDRSHPVCLSAASLAACNPQTSFEKGDWVRIDFGWRKVEAEVVGFYKDGSLRLHYDGSNNKHRADRVTKIDRPSKQP